MVETLEFSGPAHSSLQNRSYLSPLSVQLMYQEPAWISVITVDVSKRNVSAQETDGWFAYVLGQSKSDQQDDIAAVFWGIVYMCSVKTEMALLVLSAGQSFWLFSKERCFLSSLGEALTKLIMAFKKYSSASNAKLWQQ